MFEDGDGNGEEEGKKASKLAKEPERTSDITLNVCKVQDPMSAVDAGFNRFAKRSFASVTRELQRPLGAPKPGDDPA